MLCFLSGGVEIQKECSAFIKQNGSLLPAQFYVSKPGRLPCAAVIHAVGPIWSSGHRSEQNLLYETIFNVLEEADARGYSSVALPAVSTGIYRFPLELAAVIIVDAVKNFAMQPTPSQKLRQVHLVDPTSSVARQFCRAAEAAFTDVEGVELVHAADDDTPANTMAAGDVFPSQRPGE